MRKVIIKIHQQQQQKNTKLLQLKTRKLLGVANCWALCQDNNKNFAALKSKLGHSQIDLTKSGESWRFQKLFSANVYL